MSESMGSFKLINASTTDTTTSKYIVQPVAKRIKNPSSIWKYYGIASKESDLSTSTSDLHNPLTKIKNNADDRFLCLLCFQKEKIQLYKKSTSSGNLWRHLNRMHNIIIPKCMNTAINIRSEILSPKFSQEIEENIQEENVLKNDLEFQKNEIIDSYKDIGSLLIDEISKHPFLYENFNCNSNKYHKLWNEIYENLGKILDIKRLQEMWENIRDRYIRIRHCEKNENNHIKYKYYNQLKFLDNRLLNDDLEREMDNLSDSISIDIDEPIEKKHRTNDIDNDLHKEIEEYIITEIPLSSPQNLNETNNDDSSHRICITANTDDNINKYDLNNTTSSSSHNYSTHTFDNHHNNEQIEDNNFKIVTSTMPCLESEDITSNTVQFKRNENITENINIQQENYYSNNKPDELDLFGRFVAEKMRNIPKSKWDNLQIKILEILKNEQN